MDNGIQNSQCKNTNRAARITASVIGAYAGFLGIMHGCFEILQGDVAPGGIGINAMGAPCRGDAVWHACLPAMTIIPNLRITGIFAVLFSLASLVWATLLITRKNGGLILILLSVSMLLFGAGFVPTFTAIIAGLAGARAEAPLTFFRKHSSGWVLRFLAGFWPWILFFFVAWSASAWVLGHYFNPVMMKLGSILFLCDLALPGLAVIAGLARDALDRER